MKIIIHSLDELKELAELISSGSVLKNALSSATVHAPGTARDSALAESSAKLAAVERRIDALKAKAPKPDPADEEGFREPAGYAASAEKAVRETSVELRKPVDPETVDALDPAEVLDANGRPWDEEIDSAAKTKTAKGVWTRSRRRDLTDERYNERVAELIEAQRALSVDEAEPVATETHALPSDESAPTVGAELGADLTALVEGCRELADGTDGDMRALLDAAKGFIGEYGTSAFDDLKRAVVPDESGNGKALPALKDPERQLLRACIDNYANFT